MNEKLCVFLGKVGQPFEDMSLLVIVEKRKSGVLTGSQ